MNNAPADDREPVVTAGPELRAAAAEAAEHARRHGDSVVRKAILGMSYPEARGAMRSWRTRTRGLPS